MPFEIREHTADVGVEAWGDTLGETFAAVADGMAACMFDEPLPDAGERFEIEVSAEGLEALLFDYLDRLIIERDVRNVFPVDNEALVDRDVEPFTVEGSARGVPLELIAAREVKAVTYADMRLEECDEGWRALVVFDV